ncbi:MAG: hypothetical protein HC902_14775 [Calothrix sp. SM1_5_4]|nr:hypothetical protein [Calothrix sp. SM1_5_4]
MKEFVDADPKLRFDRCHFMNYGESSLDFELVFFVNDPEYNVYMDLQQKLLVAIYRKFAEQKIDFAFPTRTVVIDRTAQVQTAGQNAEPFPPV